MIVVIIIFGILVLMIASAVIKFLLFKSLSKHMKEEMKNMETADMTEFEERAKEHRQAMEESRKKNFPR